jgi:hypothetical protein
LPGKFPESLQQDTDERHNDCFIPRRLIDTVFPLRCRLPCSNIAPAWRQRPLREYHSKNCQQGLDHIGSLRLVGGYMDDSLEDCAPPCWIIFLAWNSRAQTSFTLGDAVRNLGHCVKGL